MKMKAIVRFINLLLLLGMMLHAGVASAQSQIISKVVNSKTGEALPFVSIYIDGDKNTISNVEGEFVIDADPGDVLRISCVGYKTVRISAKEVGEKVSLVADEHTLDEVVVHGSEYYVKLVMKQLKKEMKKWKWERYTFFYRQVSFTDQKCTSFLESFFTGLSAYQMRDLILAKGRFWAVARSTTAMPLNFFTFAQVPIENSEFKAFEDQLVPLIRNYKDYYQVECRGMNDGERDMVVLHFVPRKMNLWSIECQIYVDANTYQLLRYEGMGHNNIVKHTIRGVDDFEFIDHSFVVNYKNEHGFAEVESVHFTSSFESNGQKYQTTGTVYNVAERFGRLKGKLGFSDNLIKEIAAKGYDKEFWRKNEIVKRTPIEENIVDLIESDNLFGVFEEGDEPGMPMEVVGGYDNEVPANDK